MSYKLQSDRKLVIRLNKALLRAGVTLGNPHWVNQLPTNYEPERLVIPNEGDKLLPAQVDQWFAVAKMCLSDLQRMRSSISHEDYMRHMKEVSDHLSQWANTKQGPRADMRSRYEDLMLGGL